LRAAFKKSKNFLFTIAKKFLGATENEKSGPGNLPGPDR
jgi:hypothetical protein